jgi:hypothetical protein
MASNHCLNCNFQAFNALFARENTCPTMAAAYWPREIFHASVSALMGRDGMLIIAVALW